VTAKSSPKLPKVGFKSSIAMNKIFDFLVSCENEFITKRKMTQKQIKVFDFHKY